MTRLAPECPFIAALLLFATFKQRPPSARSGRIGCSVIEAPGVEGQLPSWPFRPWGSSQAPTNEMALDGPLWSRRAPLHGLLPGG